MFDHRSRSQVVCAAMLAAVFLLLPASARGSQPCISCMKKPFAAMDKALTIKNAKLFAKQWHPAGYTKNLVGGSGLPGRAVFRQGSRKGWFMKPNFAKLRGLPMRRGGPWIVPCDIWSRKRGRPVDKVWALLIYHNKRSVVLGAGEKLAQVEALGKRWVEKKPLAAPKK
jgi:hypothetical protein